MVGRRVHRYRRSHANALTATAWLRRHARGTGFTTGGLSASTPGVDRRRRRNHQALAGLPRTAEHRSPGEGSADRRRRVRLQPWRQGAADRLDGTTSEADQSAFAGWAGSPGCGLAIGGRAFGSRLRIGHRQRRLERIEDTGSETGAGQAANPCHRSIVRAGRDWRGCRIRFPARGCRGAPRRSAPSPCRASCARPRPATAPTGNQAPPRRSRRTSRDSSTHKQASHPC